MEGGEGRRRPFFPSLTPHLNHSPHPTIPPKKNTAAEFIKFGIPLQLVQFATVTLIFVEAKYRWVLAGAAAALLAVVAVLPNLWAFLPTGRKAAIKRSLTQSVSRRRKGDATPAFVAGKTVEP